MRSCVLYILVALTGMVFGAEIVASHITQSLVLLISSYHMLYNFLSLLLLIISHRMSKGKTLTNTFGWARVKVLGLLVNMLFLAALCFAAVVEAVQTAVHAAHEDTEPAYPSLMVVLGLVNFALNVICFVLIGGYTHHQGCSMIIQGNDVQMNCVISGSPQNENLVNGELVSNQHLSSSVKCVDHQMLDVFRDISSCLSVIACGTVILLLDGLILKYADAILAIASVIVLLSTTYPFIRESGLILLQSIPSYINVEGLTQRLTSQFPDVQNVHDLHVWRLTSSVVIATVHVILQSPHVYASIEPQLHSFFKDEGIGSVTLQPEFAKDSGKFPSECILQCSVNNNCGAFTCCGPISEKQSKQPRHRGHRDSRGSEDGAHDFRVLMMNHDHDREFDFTGIMSATETTL